MENAGKKFRALLARPQGVWSYGIDSAISAIEAEKEGVEVIYVGGYSAAGSKGLPDTGLLTATQMIDHFEFITKAVHTPLILDIDDGYGNLHNALRVAESVLRLPNVAAIHMEDQKYPKRCGHISGKAVVPMDEFDGKLKAIIDLRNEINPDCCIIARTDAFSASGGKKDVKLGGDIEESVRRAADYFKMGADLFWCEFPNADLASAEAFAKGVRVIHSLALFALNMSPSFSDESWQNTEMTDEKLSSLGYKFVFSTYPALIEVKEAVRKSSREFVHAPSKIEWMKAFKAKHRGTQTINEVVGVARYLELERKYDPRGAQKQATSEGFGSLSNPH